jgi:hypothetical protein
MRGRWRRACLAGQGAGVVRAQSVRVKGQGKDRGALTHVCLTNDEYEVCMDLTFECPQCKQEMVVDASGGGSEVECPGCGATVTIPKPDVANIHVMNPIASSAAAKEIKHFAVPVHEGHSEVLIEKALPPLEVASKETDKIVKIRTIRHTDCIEVGHDRFDEIVSQFLGKTGHENIISISTINYTHMDMAIRQLVTDFGVLIVYKG